MFTEADVQSLVPGQVVHGDEQCRPYRITAVKPAKNHPDHFEAWAVSPSGAIVIRLTCNSRPSFHRASDHEVLPKKKPRPKVLKPPQRRKVKRSRRAA